MRAHSARGSSPLTRGKRVRVGVSSARAGLIPAHAGKTSTAPITGVRSWAHPRSRGENINAGSYLQTIEGSSPLTRGKRSAGGSRSLRGRLIPAHAGKTVRSGTRRRRAGAHPRSRGENSPASGPPSHRPGSSPLTRGKLYSMCACCSKVRLIPAHAGKTTDTRSTRARPRAHPRSRGENCPS